MEAPEKKKNSFLDTILGTIRDESGNGSSKRATSFYFVTVLITAIHGVLIYRVYCCGDTTSGANYMSLLKYFLLCDLGFVSIILGLTSFDKIFDFIKAIKGAKTNEKSTDPVHIDPPVK